MSRRILVIDDNRDIHADFRKVFQCVPRRDAELDALERDLFGEAPAAPPPDALLEVEIDSAYQGEEGVRMAFEAARAGRPYFMACVDIRMPPGIDGVQTIRRLWQDLPDLQCVICTAFSDYGWEDIVAEVGKSGNLLILKKPFDAIEVLQVVQAFAEKTDLAAAARDYQRRLEEQVEQLRQVEADLRRNNEDLRAARAEADSANRAKSEFLANMSHELRTPLNGVIGMTALLLDTSLTAQQQKYARTVRSSAETLLEILNDILDFSKIEAGKLELETTDFDLARVVEPVIEMVAHRCREKRLELVCFADPAIPRGLRGDPGRLRQILANLTTNAVKFTESGEVVVRVSLVAQNRGSARIRFSVRDTGIGIPRDRYDRLFDAFSQVDASTTRRFGGTGLGLAISRQLCGLMGGELAFESEPGRGSTFWFTVELPVAAPCGAEPGGYAALQRLRVLAVDDHARTREILRQQLEAWGLEADIAGDLDAARARLADAVSAGRPHNVVLLDVEIPDLECDDFIPEARALVPGGDAEFILLTPIGMQLDAEWLRRVGVRQCLTKPIMQSELFNALVRVAEARHGGGAAGGTSAADLAPAGALPKARRTDARILIAEDNEINQDVAVEILTRAGYACDVVGDGARAVEALAARRYGLVLMDCQMPTMDGFEATRRIRDSERERAMAGAPERPLPILALTANALKGDRERCLEAGMTGYLSKPLNPVELLETIDGLLNQALAASPQPPACGPRPAPAAPEASAPLVDFDELVRRCMGNHVFAERLRSKFFLQALRELEQIEDSLKGADAEGARRVAHSLKGAAANVACEPIRNLAERLEEMGRAGDLAKAPILLSHLQGARRRLQLELNPGRPAEAACPA